MPGFGEYIVYVDESGDHSLTEVNPDYPRFVLAFCVFRVADYIHKVVPAVERLKFEHFGHDMVVLHEHEIRKQLPPFQFLRHPESRLDFLRSIDRIVSESDFTVVASVIRKEELRAARGSADNPYDVALEFGMERVYQFLLDHGQRRRRTHIVFESRGRREDLELELAFRRILASTKAEGMVDTLEFLCASKLVNSPGLQIADMIARPIGINDLRPEQKNHAWDLISPKFRSHPQTGEIDDWGKKVYP